MASGLLDGRGGKVHFRRRRAAATAHFRSAYFTLRRRTRLRPQGKFSYRTASAGYRCCAVLEKIQSWSDSERQSSADRASATIWGSDPSEAGKLEPQAMREAPKRFTSSGKK